MVDLELLKFSDDVAARSVLLAYCDAIDSERQTTPEFTGWTARLRFIPGVKSEEMSRIHGRLIAFGLLRFQLAGGTSGMTYQVSGAGRQLINRPQDGMESDFADAEPLSQGRS